MYLGKHVKYNFNEMGEIIGEDNIQENAQEDNIINPADEKETSDTYLNIPWQSVIVFPNPDFKKEQKFINTREALSLRKKCFSV